MPDPDAIVHNRKPVKKTPKTAMILAAGFGKRMQHLTTDTPKPLIEVSGRSLIERVLDRLQENGIENVVINTHYLAEKIETRLRDRKTPAIAFSREKDILETGGGIENALPKLGKKPFFVVNSDTLWLDSFFSGLERMAEIWDSNKMDALLLLHSTVDAYGYDGAGDFNCDPSGLLSRRPECEVAPWLFTGIQILHPRLFKNAPGGAYSLNVLFDRALEKNRLYGVIHDGEWFHVGTPEGLNQAENYLQYRYGETKHR